MIIIIMMMIIMIIISTLMLVLIIMIIIMVMMTMMVMMMIIMITIMMTKIITIGWYNQLRHAAMKKLQQWFGWMHTSYGIHCNPRKHRFTVDFSLCHMIILNCVMIPKRRRTLGFTDWILDHSHGYIMQKLIHVKYFWLIVVSETSVPLTGGLYTSIIENVNLHMLSMVLVLKCSQWPTAEHVTHLRPKGHRVLA